MTHFPPEYAEGHQAHHRGLCRRDCPYAAEAAPVGTIAKDRETSSMTRRHWWLAGWHDADMTGGSHG